jgi:PKD domain
VPVSGTARIGFNHTDLNGWSISVVGGTDAGKGSVRPGSAYLEEGDSFLVGIEQAFVVPVNPAPIVFTYTELNFDTSDPDSINDAFEASLVGPDGKPLVYAFNTGRDSFFNATESVGVALGPNVTETGDVIKTVTVDVSNLIPGTQATLRFRLVNNDQDTGTTVRILDVEVPSDNHTPELASIPNQSAAEGSELTVTGAFSDPDSGDAHTATVAWGDGTTSDAAVVPHTGGGNISATHTYADDGVYAANMTVRDSKGATSSPMSLTP